MTHIMHTTNAGSVNASVNSGGAFSNARSNQLYTASAILPTSNSLQPQQMAQQQSILLPSVMGQSPLTASNVKRSLNREARKKQLLKITMENQAILKRLQDQQPNYKVTRWEEEENHRKKLLRNICEYPYQIDQPAGTLNTAPSNLMERASSKRAQTNYEDQKPQQADFIIKRKSAHTSMPFYKKRVEPERRSNPDWQEGYRQLKAVLHYQGEHDLGNGPYYVEIFST